ncbi:hypothetical protein RUM44_008823 [Polyplax serrata]|uniref:Uncharacterized protein n=1 Tax=Polyplax serrata TaxID=468196 RepID=A0ABR1BB99_POLSC
MNDQCRVKSDMMKINKGENKEVYFNCESVQEEEGEDECRTGTSELGVDPLWGVRPAHEEGPQTEKDRLGLKEG